MPANNNAPIAHRFGPQESQADSPANVGPNGLPQFYECGICGHMHPLAWDGDCRDDANRFTADDLDGRYGGFHQWEEVPMPGSEDDEEDCPPPYVQRLALVFVPNINRSSFCINGLA